MLAAEAESTCQRAQQDEVCRVSSQLSKISVEKEAARIKALEEQRGLHQMGPAHSESPVPRDKAVAAASKACGKTTPQAGGSDAGPLLSRQWGSQGEVNQGSETTAVRPKTKVSLADWSACAELVRAQRVAIHLVKIQILFNSNELMSLFTKGVGVGGWGRGLKKL